MSYVETAEKVNIVKSVGETIDDLIDAIIGGRPITRLLNILENIGPAKVIRKLGLPAPGDLPDKIAQEIEASVKAGTLPRPPAPWELVEKLRR